MKSLILFFFLLNFQVTESQVIFEINEPIDLRGVYPCKSPNASEWSSPNLGLDGMWFSDTVVSSDDGVVGSSCTPLLNSVNNNIVITRNDNCSLSTLLLNIQNAGATGAIVIDSINGRPLAFSGDAFSTNITIPFILISKDEGDSLMARLVANETVIVSFGDKTGMLAQDLGIYCERSLWFRYSINDALIHEEIDTDFGAWIYNHGNTTYTGIQLEMAINNVLSNATFLSPTYSIAPADSVFAAISIPSTDALPIGTSTLDYQLIVPFDDDTLDNQLSQSLRKIQDQVSSNINGNLSDGSLTDYALVGPGINTNNPLTCFILKNSIGGYNGCLDSFKFWIHTDLTTFPIYVELDFLVDNIQNSNGQPQIDLSTVLASGSFDFEITSAYQRVSVPIRSYIQTSEYYGVFLTNLTSVPFYILFESDSFHDERMVSQESLHHFYYVDESAGNYMFSSVDKTLTPLFVADFDNFECDLNVGEPLKDELTIFPNPASESIQISGPEWQSLEVTTLTGQQVLILEQYVPIISVSELKSGLYLISISNNHTTSTSLFLKE